jgi:hypothetical protein
MSTNDVFPLLVRLREEMPGAPVVEARMEADDTVVVLCTTLVRGQEYVIEHRLRLSEHESLGWLVDAMVEGIKETIAKHERRRNPYG